MVHKRNDLVFEIVLVLLKEKMHLREIARQLEEPHPTVLRKINTLVKDNVLSFKVEGKNKLFFIKDNLYARNYIFMAEKYKLAKLLKKYPKLNVILDDVLSETDERMVILFGSYAKFHAKAESDIDIYVDTNDKKIKENVKKVYSKINVKIGEFDESSLLIKEIINDHIILRGIEEFYEKSKFFS